MATPLQLTASTLPELFPGAKYHATHQSSVDSVLLPLGVKREVVSTGARFWNRDSWYALWFANHLAQWARENPTRGRPTPQELRNLLQKVHSKAVYDPAIVIARTPEQINHRVVGALIGGAYHEAWHTKYSRRHRVGLEEAQSLLEDWDRIDDWSKSAGLFGQLCHWIEDIRIERLGCQEYPGAHTPMCDLADFVISQEMESRRKAIQRGKIDIQSPDFQRGVFLCAMRDIGLGYSTPATRDALGFYRKTAPSVVALFARGGLLRPLLNEAMALGHDDLGFIRIAIQMTATLYEASQPPPQLPEGEGEGSEGEGSEGEGSEGEGSEGEGSEGDDDSEGEGSEGEGSEGDDDSEGEGSEGDDDSEGEGSEGEGSEGEGSEGEGSEGEGSEGEGSEGEGSEGDDDSEGEGSEGEGSEGEGSEGEGSEGEGSEGEGSEGEGSEGEGSEGEGSEGEGSEGEGSEGEGSEGEGSEGEGSEGGSDASSTAAGAGAGAGEEEDVSQIAENILSGSEEDSQPQDSSAALELAFAAATEEEDKKLQKGELPWCPFSTANDVAIIVPSSPSDVSHINDLLQSVHEETAFLRARLRNIVRAQEMTDVEHGLRRGRQISGRMLVDSRVSLMSGEMPNRAYQAVSDSIDTSLAFCLCIDESSSMRRILDSVRKGALILMEPLDAIGAKSFAFGFRERKKGSYSYNSPSSHRAFHRSGGISYDIFKAWEEKFPNVKGRFAGTKATGGTPMADGVQYGLSALNQRTEGHRVLAVLTDGLPNEPHGRIIQGQIRRATEAGVHVLGIGVTKGAKYVQNVFPDHVYAPHLRDLPGLLIQKLNEICDFSGRNRGRRISLEGGDRKVRVGR